MIWRLNYEICKTLLVPFWSILGLFLSLNWNRKIQMNLKIDDLTVNLWNKTLLGPFWSISGLFLSFTEIVKYKWTPILMIWWWNYEIKPFRVRFRPFLAFVRSPDSKSIFEFVYILNKVGKSQQPMKSSLFGTRAPDWSIVFADPLCCARYGPADSTCTT